MTTNTNLQAIGTGLRRIARVRIDNPDANASHLVLDELLELVERPRVHATPLPLSEPTSISNTLEAFEYDSQPVLLGKGDKLLADLVVDPFLVASLPTGEPFECPATRLVRAFAAGICLRLQPRSYVGAVLAVVGKVLPLKLVSCGIRGNVAQPEVNAEGGCNILILGRLGCVLFYLHVKVKAMLPSSLERRTGRLLTRKRLPLEVAQGQREGAAPVEQAQADRLALHVEVEDAGVVVNTGGLELAMTRLGIGQARRYPSDGTDGQVG